MSNLTETPQNEALGILATALRKGKEVLNYPGKLPESVPLLGGMGAGDLILGKGPELMEDMSYGSPPYKGTGWATQVDPRTLDLALTPGIASAASVALRGGKAAATRAAPAIADAAVNQSRRDFMKKAGALTAGGAATAMAPDLLVRALREAPVLAKEAIPMAAKEVAPAVAAQAVRAWTPELLNTGVARAAEAFLGNELGEASPQLTKHFLKKFKTPDELDNYMSALDDKQYMKYYDDMSIEDRVKRSNYLQQLGNDINYSAIERAVKTNKIPKAWQKYAQNGNPITMDDLKEVILDAHSDPSGFVDQTRPDFVSRLFEEYYGN